MAEVSSKLDWDAESLGDPHGRADKGVRVRRMFNAIAPTYERVNAVVSLGRDASWRRRTVQAAAVQPGESVLDIACGTGDLARAFAGAVTAPGRVVGCDFAHDMLALAAERTTGGPTWCEADAQRLPFADASFDVTSCAFGVRNFQDLPAGLREMHRVLRPGGRALILEFSMPQNPLFARLYNFYFRNVLPRVATTISGDRTGAYRYLPSSVVSFAGPAELTAALTSAGFAAVETTSMTLGIVHLFVAGKP